MSVLSSIEEIGRRCRESAARRRTTRPEAGENGENEQECQVSTLAADAPFDSA